MRLELKLDTFEHKKYKNLGHTVENLVSKIKSLGSEVLDYYGDEAKKKGLSIQVEKEYIGDKPSYPIVIRKKIKKGWFRHEWVLVGKSQILDNYSTEEHYRGLIHTPYTLAESLSRKESQAFVYAICVLTDKLKDVNYDSFTMREKCVDYITLVSLLTIAKSIGMGRQNDTSLNSQLGIPDSYKKYCKPFSIYIGEAKLDGNLVKIHAGTLFELIGDLIYDKDRIIDKRLYYKTVINYEIKYTTYNLFGNPI
jgi:hypothetical protein|nr:MAG TPA: hypothetical protein [Caudoviricetes sp.]